MHLDGSPTLGMYIHIPFSPLVSSRPLLVLYTVRKNPTASTSTASAALAQASTLHGRACVRVYV